MRKWHHFITSLFPYIALGITLLVMFGWVIQSSILVQILPTLVPMQFNTALCGFLCAAALLLYQYQFPIWTRWVVAIPVIIAGITLLQYLFHVNLYIDELFIKHTITTESSHPGRMAPNTAISYVLTGLAIFVLSFKNKAARWVVMTCAFFVLAIATTSLLGYLLSLASAYGWYGLTSMAISTATIFFLLNCTLVFHSITYDLKGKTSTWAFVPLLIYCLAMTLFLWKSIDLYWVYSTLGVAGHKLSTPYLSILLAILFFMLTIFLTKWVIENFRKTELRNTFLFLRNKKKQQILEQLSHDVRSPLGMITGFVEYLLQTQASQEEMEAYNGIAKGAQHIQKIVNDFTASTRKDEIESEQKEVEFDLREKLKKMSVVIGQLAEKKQLSYHFHVSKKVPPILAGDYEKIERILLGIVDNAVEHAAPEQPLTLHAYMEFGQLILQLVSLPSTIGREESFDLALCHYYAELMNGSLSITESKSGKNVYLCRLQVEKL